MIVAPTPWWGSGEWQGWLGVDLISGGLMHEALQATMTNSLLIISILNLLPRRGTLLSLQFHMNVINIDIKKVKGKRIWFELRSISEWKLRCFCKVFRDKFRGILNCDWSNSILYFASLPFPFPGGLCLLRMEQKEERDKPAECKEDAMLGMGKKTALPALQREEFQAHVDEKWTPLLAVSSLSTWDWGSEFGTRELDQGARRRICRKITKLVVSSWIQCWHVMGCNSPDSRLGWDTSESFASSYISLSPSDSNI